MNILTNLDLNKNQILNVAMQNLALAPTSPTTGQFYFNTNSGTFQVFSGSKWVVIGSVDDVPELVIENIIGLSDILNEKVDKVTGKALSSNDFTNALQTKLNAITAGANKVESSSVNGSIKIDGTETLVYTHPSGANPHSITKADVGLASVEDKSSATIRSEITKADVTTALTFTPINSNLKGAINGLAELDSNGLVPSSQLPSYVDDVKEYNKLSSFPAVGDNDKIYVAKDTNLIYRWSGTVYIEISSTIALGETQQSAYRGDRGKIAYDHSQVAHAPSNAQKNSDITKAEIEDKLTGAITSHTHAIYMRRFTDTVGDNVASSYTVTHNLNTKFVTVSLYDTATGEEVWTDITRTTVNAIKLDFAKKVDTNKYTVVIIG